MVIYNRHPAPFNKFRPLLENDAGSHLEDADTAASSNIVWNPITQNPFGMIRPYRRGNIEKIKKDII
jgi:hypothetical protein